MARYTLIVFFAFFCFKSFSQTCTLQVSITPSSQAICSGAAVVLTANATLGTPAYKYLWNTGETSQFINVDKAGTYTVTVTDASAGCGPVVKNITLANSVKPNAPTVANATTCPNGTATLTATAPGGVYQWYDAPVGGNLVATGASFTTPPLSANKTYYVETTVSQCASSRTPVTVTIVSTLTLTNAFICAGNTATLKASGENTYQWYDAATGGNLVYSGPVFTTPVLTATTAYFVVGTGNGCVTNRTPVTVFVTPLPQAPVVANASICSGSAVKLNATVPSGVVVKWYNTPFGGNPLIISPSYTTPALTASATYYVEGSSNGCISPRVPVTVTVNPLPPAPVVNGATICNGTTATLSAPAFAGVYQWYSSAASQTILATGNTFQTPALTSTTTYYVQSSNSTCTSKRVPVTVKVIPFLGAPSASGQVICTGTTATLTASAPLGTFQWYDAATGGNLLSSNPVLTTPPLTNDTNYYYVQVLYQGCVSPRTAVQVVVLPLPQPPLANGVTICSGSNAALSVTNPNGNYQWFSATTGGTLLATGQNYYTPPLTAATTYYVQSVFNNCVSSRTPVTVNVLPAPAPVTVKGISICQLSQATLTASTTAGTLQWYDAPSGGNLLATGPTFTTPALLNDTVFYLQNTLGQCTSVRIPVPVTIIKLFNAGFQYTEGTYCTSDTVPPKPFINNPGPGGVFSASPAGLVIDPATGQIIPSQSKPGPYKVALNSGGACPFISYAYVTIVTTPDAKFSYNGPFCQGAADPVPVFGPTSSAGVFLVSKYSKSNPSGLVIANSSTGEINLTASSPGTYTVTNTIVSAKYSTGCPLVSDSTTVVILPAATVNAGPNQTVPAGMPVQLAGSSSNTVAGVQWSADGSGTISNPASPTATYTPAAGETTVTLTLKAINITSGCVPPLPSTMTISIVPAPASTAICAGSTATLIATAQGGSYTWSSAATGGNLLSTSPNFITPPLFATTTYYEQTTVNGIAGPVVQVTVTVNDLPATPTAKSDTICAGNTTTLTASGSTGAIQWYDAKTGGNLLYIGKSYTTPVLFTSTAYYIQASSVSGCASPRTEVDVTVYPVVTITSATTSAVCSGTPLNYTITSNIVSAYSWSRATVAGISNPSVANSQTTGLINDTLINTGNVPVNVTYVITPLLANSCTGTPFNLTVTVYPPITIISPDNELLCNGTNVNYTLYLSYQPQSLTWSRAQVDGISNSPLSVQYGASIQETLTNTTNKPIDVHYIFSITTGGCPSSSFDLTVKVNPTPSVTSDTVGYACSGIPQNYIITSNVDSVAFMWSRAAVPNISNAAVTDQLSGIINETLINTGTAPVVVTYKITPLINGCPGVSFYYFVLVNISLTTVANSNSPVCLDSTIQLNTISNIAGASYLWTGPNGFSSTLQNPSIRNASHANAGTYTLTVSNNGCNSPVDSVQVLVDDPPIANAGPDQLVCIASIAVNLNGTISGGTTTGVWSTSGTGAFSPAPNQLNCQYIISDKDRNSPGITLTLTSTSPDNCTNATSTMNITFQPLPTADAGGNLEICSQDSAVKINGQVNYADSVLWTTSGSGTFSPSANVSAPFYIPGATDVQNGSVSLTLKAYSVLCNSTASEMSIKFIPPPIVNTGKQLYVIKGRPTQLFPAVSENNVQYLWAPNLNINNDTIKNPTITVTKETTYILKVTDIRGCIAEDSVLIKVLDALVIPNTFTPNGDGVNDTWVIPALNSYPGATVDIFTRYGQKVFHSDGYGKPWDGTNNGKPLPQGVYYYLIKTKDTERPLSGPITIIR